MPPPALLADIGATHARFALRLEGGEITQPIVFPSAEFRDLASAAEQGLSLLWKQLPFASVRDVRDAAIAVAGPVTGDRVELTNVAWSFSIEQTRRALGLDRLIVINDVAALAWAIPVLENEAGERGGQEVRREEGAKAFIEGKDSSMVTRGEVGARGRGGKEAAAEASVSAVVAVGTGLGMATRVRAAGREIVLASEGGHRDLAATNAREWEVVAALGRRFGESGAAGHVSVERAVSGLGLANLWWALGEIDGGDRSGASAGADSRRVEPIDAAEVARRAAAGEVRAREAVSLFSGWLGAFAGDLALTVGARDGIWLGGGVIERLGDGFDQGAFDRRLFGKGRFEAWLAKIPVRRVESAVAAFAGLGRALDAWR